jgi:hypothetical protein
MMDFDGLSEVFWRCVKRWHMRQLSLLPAELKNDMVNLCLLVRHRRNL